MSVIGWAVCQLTAVCLNTVCRMYSPWAHHLSPGAQQAVHGQVLLAAQGQLSGTFPSPGQNGPGAEVIGSPAVSLDLEWRSPSRIGKC